MANIYISDVRLMPSTVAAGASFIVAIGIKDKVYAITDKSGNCLVTKSGAVIEKIPRKDG